MGGAWPLLSNKGRGGPLSGALSARRRRQHPMAATWQPLESGLLQLVNLLTEYQKPGTNQSQVGWAGFCRPHGGPFHRSFQPVQGPARSTPSQCTGEPPTASRCERSCELQIFQQLEACKQYPDFNNYLTYIFAAGESLPIEVGPAEPTASGWATCWRAALHHCMQEGPTVSCSLHAGLP